MNNKKNGSFQADQTNSFLTLVSQLHTNNRRGLRLTPIQLQHQMLQKSIILQQMSNSEFVEKYSYYKDCIGVEDKIKAVIDEKNSELIRKLAQQLNNEHLIIFFKDLSGYLNSDHEKIEKSFYKLCSNTNLLNKFTLEKQKSILELKGIIEESWQLLNLAETSTHFNLDFYNKNVLFNHDQILQAVEKLKSNPALENYANNCHRNIARNIITVANSISHGRALQSLKDIIKKETLTAKEENTLLEHYKNYKNSINKQDIWGINPGFYKQLEAKGEQISYGRRFLELNIASLTEESKRLYLIARGKFEKWIKVQNLISSYEEFDDIYALAHKKDLNINALSKKEQKQICYVLALKTFNETTIGLLSENKVELAYQSLCAAECFYDFACGAGRESLVQVGNYIMSQPVRTLMLAGGLALAPAGTPVVTAYYLTLYAYGIYSSYGILKEDITKAIDAYQRNDYYNLGRITVRTATDAAIIKSVGNTLRSGYKLAKLNAKLMQTKQIKKGVELGLATGEKVHVLEQKIVKLDSAVDKVVASSNKVKPKVPTKTNNSHLVTCDTCAMPNVNPNKQHYVNDKDLTLPQKYKKHLDVYLNDTVKKNPPPREIGKEFRFKRHEHKVILELSCELDGSGGRAIKIAGGHNLTDFVKNNPKFKLDKINHFKNGGFEAYIHYDGIKSEPKSFFPEGTTPEQTINYLVESWNNTIKSECLTRNKMKVWGTATINGVKTVIISVITCCKDGKAIESFYPDYNHKI